MLAKQMEKYNVIFSELMTLGQMTLNMNEAILDALIRYDNCQLNDIKKISKKDRFRRIDNIDNLIINLFALFTPEARDLRELIAFLKITNEFDRIVNSSTSFIREFSNNLEDNTGVDKDFILEYAIPLQKTSVSALKHALKLLEVHEKDEVNKIYKIVVIEESKNDDLYRIIEKGLLKKIDNDVQLSNEYQNIMSALRRLEKIADRALSIASLMHYAKIGGTIGGSKIK